MAAIADSSTGHNTSISDAAPDFAHLQDQMGWAIFFSKFLMKDQNFRSDHCFGLPKTGNLSETFRKHVETSEYVKNAEKLEEKCSNKIKWT